MQPPPTRRCRPRRRGSRRDAPDAPGFRAAGAVSTARASRPSTRGYVEKPDGSFRPAVRLPEPELGRAAGRADRSGQSHGPGRPRPRPAVPFLPAAQTASSSASRCPPDFGDGEVAWTLTVNGVTWQAFGTLRQVLLRRRHRADGQLRRRRTGRIPSQHDRQRAARAHRRDRARADGHRRAIGHAPRRRDGRRPAGTPADPGFWVGRSRSTLFASTGLRRPGSATAAPPRSPSTRRRPRCGRTSGTAAARPGRPAGNRPPSRPTTAGWVRATFSARGHVRAALHRPRRRTPGLRGHHLAGGSLMAMRRRHAPASGQRLTDRQVTSSRRPPFRLRLNGVRAPNGKERKQRNDGRGDRSSRPHDSGAARPDRQGGRRHGRGQGHRAGDANRYAEAGATLLVADIDGETVRAVRDAIRQRGGTASECVSDVSTLSGAVEPVAGGEGDLRPRRPAGQQRRHLPDGAVAGALRAGVGQDPRPESQGAVLRRPGGGARDGRLGPGRRDRQLRIGRRVQADRQPRALRASKGGVRHADEGAGQGARDRGASASTPSRPAASGPRARSRRSSRCPPGVDAEEMLRQMLGPPCRWAEWASLTTWRGWRTSWPAPPSAYMTGSTVVVDGGMLIA